MSLVTENYGFLVCPCMCILSQLEHHWTYFY